MDGDGDIMVSWKEYHKYTESYWKKQKVKTNKVLRNGFMEIPAGTVCDIKRKFSGFTLETDPCKVCGVRIYIRKVPHEDVDLITNKGETTAG
jgi:hypothetical protein